MWVHFDLDVNVPTNKLTTAQCKAIKALDKPKKYFDGEGLFLYVTPSGGKIWRMTYRLAGKAQTIVFGAYPGVSLADARSKRSEVKAALRDGLDPKAGVRRQRASPTFAEAVGLYWDGRKDIAEKTVYDAKNALTRHLLKPFGNLTLAQIDRQILLDALLVVDRSGRHVLVRKLRRWCNQIFEWGVENRYCDTNPASTIRPERAFGKSEEQHLSALDLRDVPGFLARLRMEGELSSVLACRMLAYTWSRTKELRLMEWSELNRDEGVWLVPAHKMKKRRDHLVPLSDQALAIIDEMWNRRRGDRYVFESSRSKSRPMSENAILYVIHRIGYKGRMTGHGWRSVASTWANEKGYNPDAIERQLAHVPQDKVRSAYNRAEYLDQRRKMLQEWADQLSVWDVGVS